MPPSDLINVRNFRDKFAGFVRSQKDRGVFSAQSEWSPEIQSEVASRCQIADDLSFSNTAFVNPTLFHMLRQHREFNEATERELLQKKRHVAAELERKRHTRNWSTPSATSQQQRQREHGLEGMPDFNTAAAAEEANDGNQLAESSMLLAVDIGGCEAELGAQTMDIDSTTHIPESVDAHEQASFEMNEDTASNPTKCNEANGSISVSTDDEVINTDGEDDNNDDNGSDDGSSSASDVSEIEASSDDEALAYGAPRNVSAQPIMTPLIRSFEDVTLLAPQSELPEGITQEMLKRAIANSGFARSTDIEAEPKQPPKQRVRIEEPAGVSELENKFRSVKKSLDESTLASLRKANRRMVPPKYRLEVNFMTNRVQSGVAPDATPVADDEVILSVCFYNTRSSSSKMEEYLVLGSQSLTVLRDAFYCISDFLVSHRDEAIENTKDKKVSSSYFFIENTFYNDMRSPTATDYSRVIMEWANDPERQEKNPKLSGLQSRLMDGARFLDLSIRLKQPYTFVHQGDCEHVMIFTDLRLLGPKDDQFVENYPKQIFRTRHMRHKCRMCSAYPAQYVTKNDFHSGMSPCYFCEKCYTPFHFDNEGNKLLEHDVFPYANVNLM
ncbi:snRNA-activating protein of 50kDa MW C terminal-domain-containing protein [Kickxella alabastrina]|uniref:snRNA-activating protein of 50kDa MW C terminal-domain-containing protein n=1 Tax=Kickxella alabastrina TaxID=61397 RepID=UPI00221E73B2|nr:snRNA-activating protein of 50kDa MW C terminal-domain-containing protein [Kickxella alabastrina]KAI7829134.1 snRNA-activating protein of 50kDa MW C terminal-domain-containing protein [Kickxella alabastrina]